MGGFSHPYLFCLVVDAVLDISNHTEKYLNPQCIQVAMRKINLQKKAYDNIQMVVIDMETVSKDGFLSGAFMYKD
jgi:hypothetical protein